jgi:tetratricopeptide (TPR) repeat protein
MTFRNTGGPPPPEGPDDTFTEQAAGHPAQAMFNEAMNHLNIEKYDDAISVLNNIAHQYPDFEPSLVQYGLGVAYDAKGQFEWAVSYMEAAVQANVQNFEAHIHLGNIYAKIGRHPDAIAEFTFVIENNPEHELVPGLKAQVDELQNFSSDRHLVKTQFKIQLPYDMRGMELLNMIMDTGWNDNILAGSFIGEIVVRTFGGQWVMQMPRETSYIEGLANIQINPFELAAYKAEKGKAFNLVTHFNSLKEQYGF